MRALILLSVLIVPSLASGQTAREPGRATLEAQDPATDPKAEYEKRKKEAEGDIDKLWKLVEWCEAYGMKNEMRSTLRSILKLEPENRKAHEALGHVEYDGKWHDSEKKLEEYKKKKLEAEAKATGKVIYKGELVDPADVPFLEKGMTKDASGKWVKHRLTFFPVNDDEVRQLGEHSPDDGQTWVVDYDLEYHRKR